MTTETYPSDETLNALSGQNDAEQEVLFLRIGEAPYYTSFYKMLYRLLDVARRAGDLRVYKDSAGALKFGVRPGRWLDGDSAVNYAGATNQTLADNATNYIYLTAAGVLTVNQTAFPVASVTPHIALATIATGTASAAGVSGAYAHEDITDYRGRAFLSVPGSASGGGGNAEADAFFAATDITPPEAETLTAGSSSDADSLHKHASLDEAKTFFAATDVTGTEAETLTGGASSDAKALHTHSDKAGLSIFKQLNDEFLANGRHGSIINCKYITNTPDAYLGMDDATHNATYLFNNRYARLDFRGVVNRVILSIGKLTDIVRIRLVIFRFVAWSGGGYISSARVVSTSQWIAKANLVADADNDFSSLTWAWAACEHYHDIGDFLGIEINGESGAGSSSQALAIKTGLTAGWTDCSSATTLPDAGTVVSFTSAGQTGKQPKFTVYSNIPHIVMFGDSVAIGAAATYPYWTPFMNDSQRPDPAYQNPANNPAWWLASETGLDCATIGEGGTTVWTWLPANGSGRFSRLTDCTPKAAVCVVGINDIYAEATYGEGIETYMTRLFGTSGIFPTLIAAGTLCIMVSIPPISKTSGKPAPWDDSNNLAFEVRAWNNRLRKECRTLGVAYADFFNSVINPYTRIGYAAPYDFGDAVHLSTAGNKLMADSIVEAIRQSAS